MNWELAAIVCIFYVGVLANAEVHSPDKIEPYATIRSILGLSFFITAIVFMILGLV